MCGIIGIFSHKPVAQELYDGLIHLQHRGQDAAGILTFNKKFHTKKGAGYVREVFEQKHMERLLGNMGIGHTRYSTIGDAHSVENAQPQYIVAPYGVGMAHNGNLTNYNTLKKELRQTDKFNCNTDCDIEAIMGIFVTKLYELKNQKINFFEKICEAVNEVFNRARGGYSVLGLIADKGMVAFRDPHGIRPFTCGMRTNNDGTRDYIFSSENTMYYPLGFKYMGNVQPGEVVFINMDGQMQSRILQKKMFTPCVFEYVYLARPDSFLNNISVYRSRLRMGQNLANKWKKTYPGILPDILIPVPFSSNTAALSMAHELGVRYSEGLYKNQFVGRSFMLPGQEKRKKTVLQKLSPQEVEIKGKKVMLLDDSIVRGTTSKEVVKLIRDAGAKKVYFVTACPPIKYPDVYGIDMPTRTELIGANKSIEEIRQYINADILMYQDIEDLAEAVTRRGKHNIDRLHMACLDGWYVTGDIDENAMKKIELTRGAERQ